MGVEGDAELLAAADLLRAGHDEMLAKGRCPVGVGDVNGAGAACMYFSLIKAKNTHGYTASVTVCASEMLAQAVGGEGGSGWAEEIGRFNDTPGRTDDECFDAFVTAEKALRERAARAPVAGRVGGGAEGREEVPRG